MSAPLLLDLSHTCHTRARTGIQRVTRSLASALGPGAAAVTHDPYQGAWRSLAPWEQANLAATEAAPKRGAHWPVAAKVRGRVRHWLGAPAELPDNSGLVVPEVFSPVVAAALPALLAAVRGPKVALFHDAIALKLPELSPPKTVARFPAYLTELLAFDGIAAVSADSRDTLLDYWRWLGVDRMPAVQAIPLGVDTTPTPNTPSPGARPVVLCVGSIEGRKNHLALLAACEQLWAEGADFSLHLIGLAHRETGAAACARLEGIRAAGRPVRYDGPVDDAALEAAYAACSFTVYPSLMEGFGLPVIESLRHGKPCICSAAGALGESARDGGCLTLADVDATSLAAGVRTLLQDRTTLARLSAEAAGRRFRSWQTYADSLAEWMRGLPGTSRKR
jgi:glycosyltransferase involved in cell wall biosynthesis